MDPMEISYFRFENDLALEPTTIPRHIRWSCCTDHCFRWIEYIEHLPFRESISMFDLYASAVFDDVEPLLFHTILHIVSD